MCANDDGYAGSGWVEASVPELLGSGDDCLYLAKRTLQYSVVGTPPLTVWITKT